MVAVGLAQEYAWVATAGTTHAESGYPHFTFGRAQRRLSCVSFYLWDADFGPPFIKVCAYLPERHEAPCNRVEVKCLHRDAVAAA